MKKEAMKFTDKAVELFKDVYDISGGSVVVTELPEVGEEHTIYELQETSKESYGWVFRKLPTDNLVTGVFLVFDTYEQMTSTFNAITTTKDIQYQAYIRNENKMYCVWFGYPKEGGDPYWVFDEEPKKEDESGTEYAFQLTTLQDYQTFYILKEFVGNERPVVDGGYESSYLTLDNKEVYIGNGCGYILSDIVHPNEVTAYDFIIKEDIITSNALPNSVELETNYYNLLRATNGIVICYNTSDNKYYDLIQETKTYYWYNNPQNREDCYFAVRNRKPAEPPLHYEGELEWEEIENFGSTTKFNDIPYNDIINCSGKLLSWIFQPSKAGEVTTSYWIYTNDKWVNVDEIDTNPSLHKTIFGTLTYTGDEEELQCSLTLEEMADAIAQGNFVVLELYMGDESKGDYYYCAVSEVFVGGEGPDSATIIATWSFAEGWIVWNSNTGAFAFNNGVM